MATRHGRTKERAIRWRVLVENSTVICIIPWLERVNLLLVFLKGGSLMIDNCLAKVAAV
jgi:hypothetical protein